MEHYFKKTVKFLIVFTLIFQVFPSLAQLNGNPSPINFPVPKGISNQLFYLQRDPNTNTIICQLNVNEKGELIKEQPINVFWLRFADKEGKQELNYVQRKFAYGIQTKEIGNGQYHLNFVSYKKLSMLLSKDEGEGKFNVYVNVNNKKIKIERIFVRIEGGSFWVPNVRYVEFKGYDTLHPDKLIMERIKI